MDIGWSKKDDFIINKLLAVDGQRIGLSNYEGVTKVPPTTFGVFKDYR